MKPFNLEAAKNGAKLVTEEGKPARIFCYDFLSYNFEQRRLEKCIAAAIKDKFNDCECEYVHFFNYDGENLSENNSKLFIETNKKQGWLKISREKESGQLFGGIICNTEEEAQNLIFSDHYETVAIGKIEWEE